MDKKSIEIIGWYGVVALIIAYGLISFSLLKSSDFVYQFLNLTGAIGIIVDTFSKRDYQPTAVNIVWAIIAFIALLKIIF